MKKEIKNLQLNHTKDRERYLDKKFNEAHDKKDVKKLMNLVQTYQDGMNSVMDSKISCIKDKDGIARTNDQSILEVMTEYWGQLFTNDKDITLHVKLKL